MYSYNVSVRGQGLLFRYDNQHPDELYPGHLDPHHRHAFDFATNQELPGLPEWIVADKWPTLDDVIGEAWDWHSTHYALLNHPEDFVPRDQLEDGLSRSCQLSLPARFLARKLLFPSPGPFGGRSPPTGFDAGCRSCYKPLQSLTVRASGSRWGVRAALAP